MSQTTKMFAPAMRKTGFFSEWARYIDTESTPSLLANLVLEHMRDGDNGEIRKAASFFSVFIKTRSWADVLSDLRDEIPAKEFESLEKPFAKEFYDGMRHLILTQVEAYWREFEESQPQPEGEKESQPQQEAEKEALQTLSTTVVELVKQQVAIQMTALVPTIVAAMKKAMREESGDTWKDKEGN